VWELSQIPAGNNIHHSTKNFNHTLYKLHLARQLFHQNYVFFSKCLQSYLLFKLDRIKKNETSCGILLQHSVKQSLAMNSHFNQYLNLQTFLQWLPDFKYWTAEYRSTCSSTNSANTSHPRSICNCFTITKNHTMGCKQDRTVVCHVFCNENARTAGGGGWRKKRVERAGLEIIKILMTPYQMQWAY